MSLQAEIVNKLHQMKAIAPGIKASGVITSDGLIVASDGLETDEEDLFAARSVIVISVAQQVSQELGIEPIKHISIKGDKGTVFMIPLSERAFLVILADPQAKLGALMLAAMKTAEELRGVV